MIEYNVNLKKYNSYAIDAIASTVVFPQKIDDFFSISKLFNNEELIIIGGGNNIIFSKPFYENKKFIIISNNFSSIEKNKNIISILSGTSLKTISEYALENSLTGFEEFYDIPGTIGGATLMNAGTGDISIGNLISQVTYFDFVDGKIKNFPKDMLKWGYRTSIFQKMRGILLSVDINLINGDKDAISNKMESIYKKRHEKQPREFPNAGSVFKRPEGYFAGTLIEEIGLKGFAIGGAKVSEKHAGFIINNNNATGKNIIDLINFIKVKVYKEKGVILELEQIII